MVPASHQPKDAHISLLLKVYQNPLLLLAERAQGRGIS